jgi:hypothetical protein
LIVVWLACASPEPAPGDSAPPPPRPGPTVAAQMHLHGPISEGDTTYGFQGREAERFGVDVLWWTDHDHMYDRSAWAREPQWATGGALVTEAPPSTVASNWWSVTPPDGGTADLTLDPAGWEGAPAMVFEVDAKDKGSAGPAMIGLAGCAASAPVAVAAYQARGDQGYNELSRPLLSEVTVSIALQPDVGWEAGADRVRVRLPLSMVEDGVNRAVWWAEEDDPFPRGPLDVVVPIVLDPGVWSSFTIDLSSFARDNLPEGLDLALQGLEVIVAPRGDARVLVAGVRIEESVCCEELLSAQERLFEELPGPVTHLIGLELSYESTRHLTAFGNPVFVDYETLTLHQPIVLVDWAHAQGARVAVTHVFGPSADVINPSLDRDATVAATCDELAKSQVYGADYLEVGYPVRSLDITAHLEVWDCLMARGFVLPGIGTSDNHFTRKWDTLANPFVTWILTDRAETWPMLDALSAGRAFFGDPVRTNDPYFDLRSPVGDMGAIVGDLPAEPVVVEAELMGADGVIRWVVDGEVVATGASSLEVVPGPWTVVRAEVWSIEQRPLLFSNALILSTEPQEGRAVGR